jgi:hypothetical protein
MVRILKPVNLVDAKEKQIMATKKAAKKAASEIPAVNMKALAAELGVPVKEGKVSAVRDRYYVTVGQTKREIPVGEVIDLDQIKALAGKPVSVITAGRNVVAIAGVGWKPPIIVCYIPVPDFVKGIRQDLRATILKAMVDRQVITPALQERLLAGK